MSNTMKRLIVLFLTLVVPVLSSVLGQTFTATIQNQTVSGTDFYYDIYVLRTGSTDIYLGNADFVLTFNNTYFTSPTITVTEAGAPSSKIRTWYSVGASILSSNRAVVDVTQPSFSTQAEFDSKVEVMSNTEPGTLIATVRISGINNPSGTAGLNWRLSGLNNTVVFSLANTSPWTSSDITSGGTFTNPSDAPLPVQVTSFIAEAKRLTAELRWSTATETRNFGFDIERRSIQNGSSTIPAEWQKAGFVEGAGTTSLRRNYSFIDSDLKPGRYAYRLKQIDTDGSFTYAASAEVEIGLMPKQFALEQNYPNPFNPTTRIEFVLPADGPASLKVYNVAGQEASTLFEGKGLGARLYQLIFDGSQLPSGVYFYRLRFGDQVLSKRMVLVK